MHRQLLRLARSRHLLLKQDRFEEAADVAVMEAAFIVTLRDLEARRRQVARQASAETRSVAKLSRQVTTLIRGLGAVERANFALWSQRVLPPAWTAIPISGRARQAHLN
jgi:hypothetical protein